MAKGKELPWKPLAEILFFPRILPKIDEDRGLLCIHLQAGPLILKKRKEALRSGLAPESRYTDITMDRDVG